MKMKKIVILVSFVFLFAAFISPAYSSDQKKPDYTVGTLEIWILTAIKTAPLTMMNGTNLKKFKAILMTIKDNS